MESSNSTEHEKLLDLQQQNQQLTGLLSQKLFVDGIHVKEATGDADMLVVKEALIKTEELDSVVVHSRDADIFVTSFRY